MGNSCCSFLLDQSWYCIMLDQVWYFIMLGQGWYFIILDQFDISSCLIEVDIPWCLIKVDISSCLTKVNPLSMLFMHDINVSSSTTMLNINREWLVNLNQAWSALTANNNDIKYEQDCCPSQSGISMIVDFVGQLELLLT